MKNKQYYIDKIKLRHPETILKIKLIYLDRVCDMHGLISTPVDSLLEFEDLDEWLVKLISYDPSCNNIVFNNIKRNYGKYTYYGISEII